MTNEGIAAAQRRQAGQSLVQAEAAVASGATGLAVRRCQEAVELALKAALRSLGVEPPKWHDVGDILKEHRARFPASFAARIDEFSEHSAVLRERREMSLYGDEASGKDADEMFGKAEADEAIRWARAIVEAVNGLSTG